MIVCDDEMYDDGEGYWCPLHQSYAAEFGGEHDTFGVAYDPDGFLEDFWFEEDD